MRDERRRDEACAKWSAVEGEQGSGNEVPQCLGSGVGGVQM